MEDYKKDIIMVYHVPVNGLSRQQAEEQLHKFMKSFTTSDFYREYFLPYESANGKDKKIKIEIINLKGNKTENVEIKIEELDDRLMKYFEKDKWLRKQKLKNILK